MPVFVKWHTALYEKFSVIASKPVPGALLMSILPPRRWARSRIVVSPYATI
jgi:hypothetical protein